MKITHNTNFPIPMGQPDCGVTSLASYNRIVQGMVASGELRLRPGEYVKSIAVNAQGLAFVIEEM